MTTDQSDGADFRKSLLTSPGERQDVEYKSAIPFGDNTAFGLRLVKHILGMANVGGGWIVIGYTDDALQVDHNHSQEVAATYDTSHIFENEKMEESPGTARLPAHFLAFAVAASAPGCARISCEERKRRHSDGHWRCEKGKTAVLPS